MQDTQCVSVRLPEQPMVRREYAKCCRQFAVANYVPPLYVDSLSFRM